jgi:hypothetical protein
MKFITLYNKLILNEKIYDITDDVDMLYERYFNDVVESIQRSLKDKKRDSLLTSFYDSERGKYNKLLANTDTSILRTEDAKKAHLINPAKLIIKIGNAGFGSSGNIYIPRKEGQDYSTINITLYSEQLEVADMWEWDIKEILSDNENWYISINKTNIKSMISHELSHWIRDTETGHVTKLFKKKDDVIKRDKWEVEDVDKVLNQRKLLRPLTNYELDAVIHQIAQLKSDINDENTWNKLTLNDLYNNISVLSGTREMLLKLYSPDPFYLDDNFKLYYTAKKDYYDLNSKDKERVNRVLTKYRNKVINALKDWEIRLVKRLDRDNLLGKNMKTFTKLEDTPLTKKLKVQ